ncbi:LysR family transcriptional regulator [Amnibacterium sp.]|uniref:LysR family transcriptional regulator n=1 Tax=Amnibacterium sp. TaxID=1872496 RepID=UPI002619E953|nr:LysR family transcriptional regulator [Amnibacterium sp.]MCU1473031.1 transcriptional regulator, LysR family [Amnibacterium sp.]
MGDVDLRLLRYFVAVAEAGSFTKAASDLHISQPSLSQAVRRLERDVGARLIDRGTSGSRRGVGLTDAGDVLLIGARDVLNRAQRAVSAAQQAGERTRLRVGFGTSTPRELTSAVLRAVEELGRVDVSLDYVPWGNELSSLLDGDLDLVFLQGPSRFSHPQTDATPVIPVRRVAVFRSTHPLAARQEVAIADLIDEPIVDAATDRGYWIVDPRPDGSAPNVVGPAARTVDEMLAFVSHGRGMAITSSTVAATNGSNGLAFVPISDLAPAVVYLVTRLDDHRADVAAVRKVILGVHEGGESPHERTERHAEAGSR